MSVRKDKVQIEVEINGKKATGTYKELQATARQLNRELQGLAPGTDAFVRKSAELKKVNDQLATIRKETRGVAEAMKEANNTGFFTKIKEGLKNPAALIGGVTALIAAATAAAAEVARIVTETNTLRRQISQLGDEAQAELDVIATKVKSISKTFEQEEREVLLAANTLAKEFNITYEQALGNIENGFLAGANASGEFLDNVREYSTQFEAAGFSAEEFINLSIRAQQEGIFSDKGLDVVKEFGLRIREQTKAVREAMDGAFGPQFTDEIFGGINDGSITTAEALKRVSREMKNTEIPANQLQTVIADVFAAPGEDAGIQFIQTLENVQDGLESTSASANAYIEAQRELLQANEDLAFAENELAKSLFGLENGFNTVWTNLKTVGLSVLNDVIEFVEEIPATFAGVSAAFSQFFKNIDPVNIAKRLGTGEKAKSVGKAYRDAYLEGLQPIETRRQIAEEQRIALEEEEKNQQRFLRNQRQRVEEQLTGIAAIRKAIQELEKQLTLVESSDKYVEITQKIGTLTEELNAKQREFNNAVLTAAGGSVSPEFLPITEIQNAGQEIINVLAQLGLDEAAVTEANQQRISGIVSAWSKRIAQEGVDIALDKNQRIFDADRERIEKQMELEDMAKENQIGIMQEIGVATVEFLSGQKKSQKEFIKSLILILLDGLRRQVLINIAGAIGTEAASKPFPANIASTAVKTAAITAAFEVAKTAIKGFARGGRTGGGIAPPDETGQRPAGIVHEREWVAPRWMTEHPRYSKAIDFLEGVRMRGFASGGFTSVDTTPRGDFFSDTSNFNQPGTSGSGVGGGDTFGADMSRIEELLQVLVMKADRPKPAIVKREDLLDADEEDAFTAANAGF